MNFEEAFKRTVGHEGGYTENPADPGGRTKFGISQRAYPKLDIAALTLDQAKEIYRRDYWNKCGCDALPGPLAFAVFDLAVNAGCDAAIRDLQSSVGAISDGIVGPATRAAIAAANPVMAAVRVHAAGLERRTNAPAWPAFGRGWARRVVRNLLEM